MCLEVEVCFVLYNVKSLKRMCLDFVRCPCVCVQVCGTLVSMSKDGMLSKAAFDRCIRDMVPASLLDPEEKTSFSVLLSSIFFSFDRDNRCLCLVI